MTLAPPTDDPVGTYLQRYASIAAQNRASLDFWKTFYVRTREAGIELLPLKGLDLLLRCPSGLGQRPMYDIDLLVLPDEMTRLSELLESMGIHKKPYRTYLVESFYDTECEYQSVDTTLRLDVSWGIWYLDELEPLWKRRVRRDTPRGPVDLLHPEDALQYLIAYAVAHRGQFSAVFAQDLEVFLAREKESIDWPRWMSEVRQRGLQVPVFHGLDYAAAQGVTAIPKSVLLDLRPRTIRGRCQLFYYRRSVTKRPRPSVSYLFPWIAAPGWRGKKCLLKRILFPPDQTAHWRGLQSGGLFLSALRGGVKVLELLARSVYVIPREIYRLF